jgi:restriction system protein
MAIPDFQTIMLPLIRFSGDGHEHTNRECEEALAKEFRLSDEEKRAMLPSGAQPVFHNRLAWARTHLRMAGILENPRRGIFRLTERGLAVLKQDPPLVNLKFLRQFPEYLEGRNKRKSTEDGETGRDDEQNQTPEETLEDSYQSIRATLATELLQQIKASSPAFFEKLVVELLLKMGYGGTRKDAGQAIGRSGDEGIDGVINEDRLGLDAIYIQAKRWDSSIGRPEIQKFAGALQGQRAHKGIFITTGTFTKDSRDYASRIDSKIVLIDGDMLAQLMIDHDVGVTVQGSYEIKRVDSDYFTEE